MASMRTRIAAFAPLRQAFPGSSRMASTYVPAGARNAEPSRPPRPASSGFFSGKPEYSEALANLDKALAAAQSALRRQYVWPIPKTIPHPTAPGASWRSADKLKLELKMRSPKDYDLFLAKLNEVHHARHIAHLAGSRDVESALDAALADFERPVAAEEAGAKKRESRKRIDEFGRSFATGRRKESSARVWIIPSQVAEANQPATTSESASEASTAPESTALPTSNILINHLPLPVHFGRPADREAILRPLRLTGLIGAYNVFALVRGGGTTGQSGAVALALSRALAQIRTDTGPVLSNDGLLTRDPRMVERKKTGLAKARKRYTWVKR